MRKAIPLSEAVLAGSVLLTPRAHDIFAGDTAGCALGMGLIANGVTKEKYADDMELLYWPWLNEHITPAIKIGEICPCGGCIQENFPPMQAYWDIITHIFDNHVIKPGNSNPPWSLEQLCDYIRSVEPKEDKEITEAKEHGIKVAV